MVHSRAKDAAKVKEANPRASKDAEKETDSQVIKGTNGGNHTHRPYTGSPRARAKAPKHGKRVIPPKAKVEHTTFASKAKALMAKARGKERTEKVKAADNTKDKAKAKIAAIKAKVNKTAAEKAKEQLSPQESGSLNPLKVDHSEKEQEEKAKVHLVPLRAKVRRGNSNNLDKKSHSQRIQRNIVIAILTTKVAMATAG